MKIGVKEITVCSKERECGGTEGTDVCDTARQSVTDSNTVILQNKPMNQNGCQPAAKSVMATFWSWDKRCRAGVRTTQGQCKEGLISPWVCPGWWVIFWASGTKHILFTYEAFPFLNSVTSLAFGGVLVFREPPFYFSIFEHLSGLLNISRVQVLPLSLVEWISFTCWWNSFLHLS